MALDITDTSAAVHDRRGGQHRGYSPTLGWYLAGRWTGTLLLTLIALSSFIYLIDLIELLRQLSGKNIPAGQAALMALAKLPDMLIQLLPFAVLLGTLVWLNQLNRRQELVAMRASGLPARRFILGPLLACAFAGVITLVVINPISATLLKRYERWYGSVFPNTVKGLVTSGGGIWLRQDELDPAQSHKTYFIYGHSVSSNGQNLGQASVFVFNEQGDFMARLDAGQAVLHSGEWLLNNVFLLSPQKQIVHEDVVTLPTTLTAQQIQASFNPPGTLSVWELSAFIKVLEQSGFPVGRHAMAYQRLLALPILAMAMLMLAVPFGLRFTRNQGLATVILAGLGLGFGFYLFGNVVATYGLSGRLDVVLAAWLPAGMALLLAAALLIHLREE